MTSIDLGIPKILPVMMFFMLATTMQAFMFGDQLAADRVREPPDCDIEFSLSGFVSTVFNCITSMGSFVFGIWQTVFNFITFNVEGAPVWLRVGLGAINAVVVGFIGVASIMVLIQFVGSIVDAVSPF